MIPRSELFEVSSTYWLVVLGLSLFVLAGYFWRLVFSKPDRVNRWQRLISFAAAVVLCLTAVDGLNFSLRELSEQFRISGVVAVFAVTASLTWLHLSHWKTPKHLLRSRLSGWLVLLSSVGLAGWSYYRFHQRVDPPSSIPRVVVRTPGAKKVIHEFLALTDRNRPIPVYRLADESSETVDLIDEAVVESFNSVIQRSPRNLLANCHGWVFLDSQFLISGEAVQQILDDNEYELVDDPKAGDVIIYRDANRNIVHSGIVRGVLNDETVIIESKWGTEGTFLHDPEGTPYAGQFEYFRSPRPNHRVEIVPADELPMDD